MTCLQCLEKFSSLSADNVANADAISIRAHLAACPECRQEWLLFERTLFVLSTSCQVLPDARCSDEMWQRCSEHIFQKVEARRASKNAPGVFGWATRQPRWGWVTLGGALAILGATWFLAPHDDAIGFLAEGVEQAQSTQGVEAGFINPGTLVTFQRPPAAASSLINHHSAMATDPLPDSVGSTMVSYSATTPVATAPSTTAPTATAPVPAAPQR